MPETESYSICIAKMELQIQDMKTTISEIKEILQQHNKEHQELMDKLDQRYASKKIENAFWYGASVVGGILITALTYLIINKPN